MKLKAQKNTLWIKGDVLHTDIPALESNLELAAKANPKQDLIINLRACKHMNSGALAPIIKMGETVNIFLSQVPENIIALIKITGLSKIIKVIKETK